MKNKRVKRQVVAVNQEKCHLVQENLNYLTREKQNFYDSII